MVDPRVTSLRRMLGTADVRGVKADAAPPKTVATPADVFFVPPSSFSDEWERRPSEPVEMGMRLASVQTIDEAIRMASRTAWEGHPEPGDSKAREELFTQEVMVNVLSRTLTDPRDRSLLFFATAPEAQCRLALSSGGIRALWERLERLMVATSPLSPEVTDTEVEVMGMVVTGELLRRLSKTHEARARRMLGAVLMELMQLLPDAFDKRT